MSKLPINIFMELDRIFLDPKNPRHEPYDTQSEIIDYLCRQENVYQLAKDIRENGLNPLELFALIPDEDGPDNDDPTYFVAEGNRRICALKLLDDPELAPAKYRKVFQKASENWKGMPSLSCVLFEDRDAVDIWLRRIHDGEQGGIGRKKWNADQSARHSGDEKNKLALAVMDYAEEKEMISPENRKGKLTTVQRFFDKKVFCEAMGVVDTDLNDIRRKFPQPDFNLLLEKFLNDLMSGTIGSRSNTTQIEAYSRELCVVDGLTHKEITPEPLDTPASPSKGKKRRKKPQKQKVITNIPHENEIMEALIDLGGRKLPSLYNSICSVSLQSHTPLIAIGAWAFLESLSSKAGRDTRTDFPSFFNKQRLQRYGVSAGKGDKAIAQALGHLSTSGDVTKHDGTAAMFNGEQLANDMETLKELILKCIEEAKGGA